MISVGRVARRGRCGREAELAIPSSHQRAHRHLRLDAPARWGAFADERRVAAGDAGGRARTRNAHRPPGSAAFPAVPSADAVMLSHVERQEDERARVRDGRSLHRRLVVLGPAKKSAISAAFGRSQRRRVSGEEPLARTR